MHDNFIYVGKGLDAQMLLASDWEGWADGATFAITFSYADGTARYGHEVARNKDGTYEIAAGWGPAKNIVFEGNRYIGRQIDAPAIRKDHLRNRRGCRPSTGGNPNSIPPIRAASMFFSLGTAPG